MNAKPAPAKTMSRGSSPTIRVFVTRLLAGSTGSMAMMLRLSERWLMTHASSAPPPASRTATATRLRPTGTSAASVRPPWSTSKIARRLSGVLTAKSWLASGESARGRTWPASKLKYAAEAGSAVTR